MRKHILTLLAGVAVSLAAIQAASAADLPRKAPAYIPPAPPPFSWTGFYGGIHAGWAWSDLTANVAFAPAGFRTLSQWTRKAMVSLAAPKLDTIGVRPKLGVRRRS